METRHVIAFEALSSAQEDLLGRIFCRVRPQHSPAQTHHVSLVLPKPCFELC